MADDRQGSVSESATGILETVGLSEPSDTKKGKTFRWTIKRRRFCHNLVRNGGQIGKAALDAGYAGVEEGTYLLKLPQIRKYIELDVRNHLDAEQVTEESVLAKYATWMNTDVGQFFEVVRQVGKPNRMRMKAIDKLTPEARSCIKKLKFDKEGHLAEFELHDAFKATDKLAQVLGLLQPDRDQQVLDAEATARDIYAALQEMEELDGLTGDSAEEPGTPDAQVDPAQTPPSTA